MINYINRKNNETNKQIKKITDLMEEFLVQSDPEEVTKFQAAQKELEDQLIARIKIDASDVATQLVNIGRYNTKFLIASATPGFAAAAYGAWIEYKARSSTHAYDRAFKAFSSPKELSTLKIELSARLKVKSFQKNTIIEIVQKQNYWRPGPLGNEHTLRDTYFYVEKYIFGRYRVIGTRTTVRTRRPSIRPESTYLKGLPKERITQTMTLDAAERAPKVSRQRVLRHEKLVQKKKNMTTGAVGAVIIGFQVHNLIKNQQKCNAVKHEVYKRYNLLTNKNSRVQTALKNANKYTDDVN